MIISPALQTKPAMLFCLAMLHYRETVCCLPSFSRHLLVGLLHFGLRPVQQDRLRICPFQCRQRQQNISLVRAYKAGLFFAKIPNCGGQQRSLFSLSWTQSKAKETNKLVSSALRERQRQGSRPRNLSHETMEIWLLLSHTLMYILSQCNLSVAVCDFSTIQIIRIGNVSDSWLFPSAICDRITLLTV